MAVDVARRCYSCWMWWDRAQTVGSMVRWYFVDGAPFIPGMHGYTQEIFDEVHWFNDSFGQPADMARTYDKGAAPVPAPPADHYCGDPLWWEFGAPSDAPPLTWVDGEPACCTAGLRGPYAYPYSLSYDRVRPLA